MRVAQHFTVWPTLSQIQTVHIEESDQHFLQESNFIPIGMRKLDSVVEQGNKALKSVDTYLKVSVHEKTNQIVVKIIDTATDEVIKEIPPEKFLDLVHSLCEQLGIFVDEKR